MPEWNTVTIEDVEAILTYESHKVASYTGQSFVWMRKSLIENLFLCFGEHTGYTITIGDQPPKSIRLFDVVAVVAANYERCCAYALERMKEFFEMFDDLEIVTRQHPDGTLVSTEPDAEDLIISICNSYQEAEAAIANGTIDQYMAGLNAQAKAEAETPSAV